MIGLLITIGAFIWMINVAVTQDSQPRLRDGTFTFKVKPVKKTVWLSEITGGVR